MEKTPNDENMDRIVYFGNLELINIFWSLQSPRDVWVKVSLDQRK